MNELHLTILGNGEQDVYWCHGVFGQGKNFTRVAKDLLATDPDAYRCILVDLPNHGRSPWTQELSYPAMAESLAETVTTTSGDRPVHLLGHSMGGKVVMRTVLDYPSLAHSLTVVDMAPVSSPLTRLAPLVHAMKSVDLSGLTTRKQAEEQMSDEVPSPTIRQFLLQNLRHETGENDHWYWQMNLDLLGNGLSDIGSWPPVNATWDGPVLWITAEDSAYVGPDHSQAMHEFFPQVNRIRVKNSGHWVHSDQPGVFVQVLAAFLSRHRKGSAFC
ncbi:alpha/beta fold hydrolase [Cutibacterium sp.]|uniref:alpha/beta fold hydrolase n=1 Tax=Cutibacterium sp. TaxID=1912221 RepID=UPI0026DB84F0|nr:alpha/beta fold hydrolase [Cutibacterium sp.]MDO4411912.1 alpha/beta fold hydrolase [Cutibacterium sp.]